MDQRGPLQPHLRAEFQGNPDWAAVHEATYGAVPGPVHINQPFDEPLLDGEFALVPQTLVPKRPLVVEHLELEGKGFVFAGPNAPPIEAPVPIIHDGLAQGRTGDVATDLPEADWVVHIGGAPTNKAWSQQLNRHPNRIRVGRRQWDEADPTWVDADAVTMEASPWTLKQQPQPPTTPEGVALANIAGELFVGNSLAVRQWDRVGNRRAWANRGVSGIDGNIATAAGLSLAGPITAVIGDLTFQHDVGSLALCKGRNVRIVVLNNNGGRIFEHLPVASEPEFEELFVTPQCFRVEDAAKAFGLSYQACAPDRVGLATAQVVEVRIDHP
ncbi:MAG: thiamine pyrophosphate-dependent enzyme [Thermoplasmatota archaeon]